MGAKVKKDHATEHEPAGGDPMAVDAAAATGSLRTIGGGALQAMAGNATPTPGAHAASHAPQTGGDPLTCAAPGAINQNANAEGVADYFARSDHNHQHTAALHQNGGGAEINVGGLNGLLADRQTPLVNIIVVAANGSLNKLAASYVCNGTADEVTIQAALNALNATGGEVLLLDGTYNCAASIVLDSYQTLRGCGRNTILTATAADVDIITATGGSGTEKVGILIADLCIDGNAGGSVNDIGILWTYVDRSRIEGCWIRDNGEEGIKLTVSDHNLVLNNIVESNSSNGIYLNEVIGIVVSGNNCNWNATGIQANIATYDSITGNICRGNSLSGIKLTASYNEAIVGNTCSVNTQHGIEIAGSNNNSITGNTLSDNSMHGIYISTSSQSIVTGNSCDDNGSGGTYHGIYIYRSSYCTITGNVCNNNLVDGINITGDATTDSHYNTLTGNVCYNNGDDGIEIAGGADAVKNIVLGNQLLGNTGTALVDGGTNTEKAHNITA